ncbi:MAG: glycerol-3-phosphate dehydrogenase/oxidase [Thermomicrobiales bacterium]|nr:glycerol-3-phosphate dehydrogenase/oxidase [Thermomicrobiales bacterium]
MKRTLPADLDTRRYDLAIIGGGINGAAIARDAALRGLSVILLEKDDFASGTTSWATRLIHGGLRYLEHFEFRLVQESLVERGRLLENAPHLVDPLPLVLPVFRAGKHAPTKLRTGMHVYDFFSRGDALPKHRWFSRKETGIRWPQLTMEGLLGSFRYFDAQVTFPERMVIEQIVSAVSFGAVAMNYARVTSIDMDGSVATGVTVVDELAGRTHKVRARAVINVAGPWVDQVMASLDPAPNREIGGTKGSHIFLAATADTPTDAIYAEAATDGRPFFIVPWNGLTMIGTTDLPFDGDFDQVTATDDEIDYLLAEAGRLLPGLDTSRSRVLFTYAGVRPLPATSDSSPGGITRRHFLIDHAPNRDGLYSVVGGKLTTHRSLAEEVVDKIAHELGNRAPCQTRNLPFAYSPGDDVEALREELIGSFGISGLAAERLTSIYGARARDIAALGASDPALGAPLAEGQCVTGAEIVWAFENEQAVGLSDAVMRRAVAAWNAGLGRSAARGAARIGQSHLGWSADRATGELAEFDTYIERFNAPPA